MMSVHITQSRASMVAPVEGARQPLRLRLKPKAPATGFVDGAWWPRSRDLATELPDLLAVLAVRLGRIERVSYNLTAWDPTARKINVGGSVVRLGGFRFRHKDTVDVIGAKARVTLLVVPPWTSPQAAHDALMTAGHRGNTDGIAELLTAATLAPPIARQADDQAEAAEQRWELDGGRVYEGV